MIEVSPEIFDRLPSIRSFAISLAHVELRQRDGLLTTTRRVVLAEGIGAATRNQHGVRDDLPALLVHTDGEEG